MEVGFDKRTYCFHIQGGSNMTRTDFFFVTIIAHQSSNSQTGPNRFLPEQEGGWRLWLHSLKVAQLLRSAACLHTNQSRSYLNHLVINSSTLSDILIIEFLHCKGLRSPLFFAFVIFLFLCFADRASLYKFSKWPTWCTVLLIYNTLLETCRGL